MPLPKEGVPQVMPGRLQALEPQLGRNRRFRQADPARLEDALRRPGPLPDPGLGHAQDLQRAHRGPLGEGIQHCEPTLGKRVVEHDQTGPAEKQRQPGVGAIAQDQLRELSEQTRLQTPDDVAHHDTPCDGLVHASASGLAVVSALATVCARGVPHARGQRHAVKGADPRWGRPSTVQDRLEARDGLHRLDQSPHGTSRLRLDPTHRDSRPGRRRLHGQIHHQAVARTHQRPTRGSETLLQHVRPESRTELLTQGRQRCSRLRQAAARFGIQETQRRDRHGDPAGLECAIEPGHLGLEPRQPIDSDPPLETTSIQPSDQIARNLRRQIETKHVDPTVPLETIGPFEGPSWIPTIQQQTVLAMLEMMDPIADAHGRMATRGLALVRLDRPELDGPGDSRTIPSRARRGRLVRTPRHRRQPEPARSQQDERPSGPCRPLATPRRLTRRDGLGRLDRLAERGGPPAFATTQRRALA